MLRDQQFSGLGRRGFGLIAIAVAAFAAGPVLLAALAGCAADFTVEEDTVTETSGFIFLYTPLFVKCPQFPGFRPGHFPALSAGVPLTGLG